MVANIFEDFEPPSKKFLGTPLRRVLKGFDDPTADMESNKKLSPKVTELFLRGRKLNISLAFISQSYFKVPRTMRLNATHYFIMKISNKRELQQIASNHSLDIDFKGFMKLYHQIIHYDLGRTYCRNLKQSITKSSKTKLSTI